MELLNRLGGCQKGCVWAFCLRDGGFRCAGGEHFVTSKALQLQSHQQPQTCLECEAPTDDGKKPHQAAAKGKGVTTAARSDEAPTDDGKKSHLAAAKGKGVTAAARSEAPKGKDVNAAARSEARAVFSELERAVEESQRRASASRDWLQPPPRGSLDAMRLRRLRSAAASAPRR